MEVWVWKLLPLVMALLVSSSSGVNGWGTTDKVKLTDVQALTLYANRMTTGRRSSPVPQMKCVGGTAGCTTFVPQVVQCQNKGSDGFDVQWECKSDMDNAYRFGKIEVVCEGYDYPDDPYILKGSCGLEYTLDFTKEGLNNNQGGQHNYYGANPEPNAYGWKQNLYSDPSHYSKGSSGTITNIACFVVVIIIVYAIFKTCIQPADDPTRQRSRTNDDFSDPRGPPPRTQPPPPGFNPSFYSDTSSHGDSCGAGSAGTGTGGLPRAGGFWTGAATGGLLGYLFGARNNTGYARQGYGGYTAGPSTSWGGGGSSFGGGSGYSSGFSSGGGGSSSSGTRTASGFGGTRRR